MWQMSQLAITHAARVLNCLCVCGGGGVCGRGKGGAVGSGVVGGREVWVGGVDVGRMVACLAARCERSRGVGDVNSEWDGMRLG